MPLLKRKIDLVEMKITFYPTPIPIQDLQSVQNLLSNDDLICSAFSPQRINVYDCFSFLQEKAQYGTDTYFILDRNIFSRIVYLARGESVPRTTPEAEAAYRLAAGTLAFIQCCNATIEPCMAILEQSSHDENTSASEELRLFRMSDNIHPQHFADIALGRCDCLDRNLINVPTVHQYEEPSERPMWWTLNYALALKLAMLELDAASQKIKFERFLLWLHEDYIWSGSAVLFAIIYLSPKRTHGMLKRLRAQDRNAALKGVKNATWDMTLITMWSANCHAPPGSHMLWFLCSRDEAVKTTARWVVSTEANAERLKHIFVHYWGLDDGAALDRYYRQLTAKINDPARRFVRVPRTDPIWSQIPEELERTFLQLIN